MNAKRWCIFTLLLLLTGLFSVILLVVVVDPFEIYHPALFYDPPYESEKQMYSMAGIARSYEYDSIIVGSSVTENCTPSVYDAALGGRFVKLCMNGGLSLDHSKIMDIAFRTHDIDRVVYGIDLFAYSQYYNNQKARTPDYLYDENLLNDVQYWLNKSILLSEIPAALAQLGVPNQDAARDRMYYWMPPSLPGEAHLRSSICFDQPMPAQADTARALELAGISIEHNLLPHIREHRETTFTIFFPPYSLLYWADQAESMNFSSCMAQKRLITERLLAEPNVELFDFQAHTEWTENYALYYDLIHYIPTVNDQIAAALASDLCRITDAAQEEAVIASLESAVYSLFLPEEE